MKSKLLILLILSFYFLNSKAQERTNPKTQDVELGRVSWYRNYDLALQLSEKQNKPILILFQEVPGCATCRNYGHQVLTHPLMTEAIENEFIPLAIFNNKKGKDLIVLEKFKEPAWNNPVVRIINSNGENIVPRVANDYSVIGLYNAMVKALKSYGNPVPEYLKLLGEELSATFKNNSLQESYFKMYCFWTGEKELGNQDGVLATKAGFINNTEVVRVIYNCDKISKEALNNFAKSNKMTPISNQGQFVWAEGDEDYFIQHSDYKYLPLSEVQKTKINSALGFKKTAAEFLSPKQLIWFNNLNKAKHEVLYDKDFFESWNEISGLK
jgi:hypothetical protein